jgi:hypothetical protein
MGLRIVIVSRGRSERWDGSPAQNRIKRSCFDRRIYFLTELNLCRVAAGNPGFKQAVSLRVFLSIDRT